MTLKLIPPFSRTNEEIMNLLSRGGATFVEVQHLYDLWAPISKGGIVVASIGVSELMILQRHMNSLLEEVPVVVTGVAHAFYSAEWNMYAAHLVSEPYSTLETQLMKSGFTSHNTDEAVSRGNQGLPPSSKPRHYRDTKKKGLSLNRSSLSSRTNDEDEDDNYYEEEDTTFD